MTHSKKLPDPGAISKRMTQNPHQPRLHPQIPLFSPFLLHPPALFLGMQAMGKSTTALRRPLCHHSNGCRWSQTGSLLSLDSLFHAISPPCWKKPWEKACFQHGEASGSFWKLLGFQSSLEATPLSSSLKACTCRGGCRFQSGTKSSKLSNREPNNSNGTLKN